MIVWCVIKMLIVYISMAWTHVNAAKDSVGMAVLDSVKANSIFFCNPTCYV